jgi:hypothetical protein
MFKAALLKIAQRKATQVSITDKHNVVCVCVYTYIGILFSLKKEGNPDRCYKLDES